MSGATPSGRTHTHGRARDFGEGATGFCSCLCGSAQSNRAAPRPRKFAAIAPIPRCRNARQVAAARVGRRPPVCRDLAIGPHRRHDGGPTSSLDRMHSLEPECQELRAAGLLSSDLAAQAIAIESGAILSVHEELRCALYCAVLLITTGVGLLLKAHLDQIGPLALMAAVAAASATCYAGAIRRRMRAEPRTAAGDYLLLLGALLLSADLGYAETQFHWLGAHWSWYLLLLTVLHAGSAYLLVAPLLLSTALASLATWFGVQAEFGSRFLLVDAADRSATPALICAGTMLAWRALHRRLAGPAAFDELFAHFAANIGFPGAILCTLSPDSRLVGLALLMAGAWLSIRKGRHSGQNPFVVYGVAYPAIGVCWLEAQTFHDALSLELLELATVLTAVVLLWRWRRVGGTESS